MATRKPNAGLLKVEPTATHKALAEFIEKTTGHVTPSGDVALVQRAYPLFLKSPAVVKAREAEAEAKAAAEKTKAEAKEARLKERLAKVEADRQRLLKELGIETDDVTGPAITVGNPETEAAPAKVTLKVVEPAADPPEGVVAGDADDDFVETVSDDDDGDQWDEF